MPALIREEVAPPCKQYIRADETVRLGIESRNLFLEHLDQSKLKILRPHRRRSNKPPTSKDI